MFDDDRGRLPNPYLARLEDGAAAALTGIKARYGGNVVELRACSWLPPGNAIWQP